MRSNIIVLSDESLMAGDGASHKVLRWVGARVETAFVKER